MHYFFLCTVCSQFSKKGFCVALEGDIQMSYFAIPRRLWFCFESLINANLNSFYFFLGQQTNVNIWSAFLFVLSTFYTLCVSAVPVWHLRDSSWMTLYLNLSLPQGHSQVDNAWVWRWYICSYANHVDINADQTLRKHLVCPVLVNAAKILSFAPKSDSVV